MTLWSKDAQWEKAKLYAARAAAEEQEGPLFAFWSVLSLEMLGRSVLASVHPALLADPQNPENLLFGFGYGSVDRPKSVQASTVFRRCEKIVEGFTRADLAGTLVLSELRNEELHSGGTPFEGLKTGVWLADYYRVCHLLLVHLDQELSDLFGVQQAVAAERLIAGAAEELESEVQEHIAEVRRRFRRRTPLGQMRRIKIGNEFALKNAEESWAPHMLGKPEACPVCGANAWVTGEFVRSGEPVADEDAIVREIVKIPTKLECASCELEIVGNGRLHAVGLGGLFAGEIREDPKSYYQIEFDPSEIDLSDYFEPDYGNE